MRLNEPKAIELRCINICGGNACFNDNQLKCIRDIVINKACAVKTILGIAKNNPPANETIEMVEMACKDIDELLLWFKVIGFKRYP